MEFLLVYTLPALPLLSLWLGDQTGYPNAWTFMPLVVAYGLVAAYNQFLASRLAPAQERSTASPGLYRALPRLGLPVQLLMLSVTAALWSSGTLSIGGQVGLLLSTGIFSAFFAGNLSHELIHSRRLLDRVLGGLMLSTICFGAFKITHLRIHHRFVGTASDFSTARRGQTLYGFWWQSLRGYTREARYCEQKKVWWRSELSLWYGFSALWLGTALLLWGAWGGAFFILQSLLAILKIDWVNYLQHYGLTRSQKSDGRYEPVQPHHAWSQEYRISNLAFLNLLRHGDHHARPERPYERLAHQPESPCYPGDFLLMALLALITPLFRRVVHPRLDQLRLEV